MMTKERYVEEKNYAFLDKLFHSLHFTLGSNLPSKHLYTPSWSCIEIHFYNRTNRDIVNFRFYIHDEPRSVHRTQVPLGNYKRIEIAFSPTIQFYELTIDK